MLPKVENPIPETIGLETMIGIAVTANVLSLVLTTALRLPQTKRESWVRWATVGGFVIGAVIYFSTLLLELLCRQ
jgi:hypothetical protein